MENRKKQKRTRTKRKVDSTVKKPKIAPEILFCCHASWLPQYGYTVIPKNTFLYIYAPVGAALSQTIPRAIAAGEKIKPGELTIRRINPIILFNYGYKDQGPNKGNYEERPTEMENYPMLYQAGEKVPNYSVNPPGKDKLTAVENSNIIVQNLSDEESELYLEDLLKKNSGNICHFGGCSWISIDNDKRDIVTFKNPLQEKKFTFELSEEEKKLKRLERFSKK